MDDYRGAVRVEQWKLTAGLMLYDAQSSLRNAWWMSAFPGLGIFLVVLSLNLFGDAMNDALSPKSRDQ